jgi:ABC-type nitrate/sulfonate/bicarbonate transport system substrate-binding protein
MLMLALVAVSCAGCGGGSSRARARDASLILDFTPNAVHAGIYSALAHHYDRAHGLRLQVIAPSASTDSIKLLQAGRVEFAILDIHDLAIAREHGDPIVAVMAIVQRPLAAVIAAPEIRAPRNLVARTVGVTGLPSDIAVLRSVVLGSGGDPRRVRTITIGFNAVAALLAGRVAAATAFWSDEGVTLALRRPGFHSFRVDEYGAPSYPELVLCTTETLLRRDRSLVRAVTAAVVDGYEFTLGDPQRSAFELEARVPGLDPKLVAAQLHALLPAFRARDGRPGELDPAALAAWARWETRFGIVTGRPDVSAAFDPALAESSRQ